MVQRTRRPKKNKKTRVNLRVDKDLLSWAKGYVITKNTSVTQLFTDYLTGLRQQTEVGYVEQV